MTSDFFTYQKGKVIQALRYHFISRREIKLMMILVNVFAIASAALFFFKKISPLSFLISSVLWFAMMIAFWFLMPGIIYRRSATFRDRFRASFDSNGFMLENERGSRMWPWAEISSLLETPHFFHLYFDSRSFFIVPKEAFGERIDGARAILRENIRSGK